MSNLVVWKLSTSLNSVARQYLAAPGQMKQYGANHLRESCASLADAFEHINAAALAIKQAELNKINVAVLKKLYSYIDDSSEAECPQRIEVECEMNGEMQILVWEEELHEGQSCVAISVEGNSNEKVYLKNVSNFEQVYENLSKELEVGRMSPDWLDSDGWLRENISYHVEYPSSSSESEDSFHSSNITRSHLSRSYHMRRCYPTSHSRSFHDTIEFYPLLSEALLIC